MHYKSTLLAVAPMVMMARAGVEFDLDETPSQCREICRPIADLYRSCQVDLRGDDNDREEDQLEVQCFCTNDSFDVGTVAAQCQDCVRQNRGSGGNGGGAGGNRDDDRDDDRDDNRDDDRDDNRDDRDDNRDDNNDDRDDNRDDNGDDRDDNRDDNNDDQNDDWDDNQDDNRTDDRDDDVDDDRDDNRRAKRDDNDDWDDDRDDDAWEDINDIVRTCGFTSTSYLASATTAMPSSVTVTATRPTDVAQLTTTFTAAAAPQTSSPSNDDQDDGNNPTELNGAGLLAPLGAAGALVAGAMALLA